MAKDFDKDGHRDEGNGKPGKQHNDDSFSRDKEQGGSWHFQGSNTGQKWGNCGQRFQTLPRTAGGKCHKELFEETDKGRHSRKPNLNRFVCPDQIRTINNTLTRSVPASDAKAKTQLMSAARMKLNSSDSEKTPTQKTSYPGNSTDEESSASSTTREKIFTPFQKNSYPGNSTDEDSSASKTREKSSTPIQKTSYPGSSTDEESSASSTTREKIFTPFQKNSYPGNSTGEDSSARTTREKSFTPTLTDLENSVRYDCRLDKVLRVALDYALPEELGLGESGKSVTIG